MKLNRKKLIKTALVATAIVGLSGLFENIAKEPTDEPPPIVWEFPVKIGLIRKYVEPAPAPETPAPTETIEDRIKRIFPEDWRLATAIFKAESGLNPQAVGDTNTPYHSIGIAQIRMLPSRGLDKEQLKDPEYNLRYARMLKDAGGWSHWSCWKSGAYLKYY